VSSPVAAGEGLGERAAALWLQAAPAGSSRPDRVETLKAEKRKSAVVRLVGAGPEGRSIVAKRAPRDSIALEALVYRRVLSRLSVPAPRLCGLVREDEASWLFLEDAGDLKFDPDLISHRWLASHWTARAHGEARAAAALAELPERGPDHYRALQRSVAGLLQGVLVSPALSREETAIVEKVAERVTAIGSSWNEIESRFEGCPQTLVLGGFGPKNARVRDAREGPELVPFDFESAGRGCPAIDLVYVDGDAYLREARAWWPDLDAAGFDRLQALGRVLRVLKAIPGERSVLLGSFPAKAVAKLRWYLRDLEGPVS
jgi:hypothetical protein